jgi:GrpB-like predicted nucleotidyltransferase (UPF0157 family)
VKLRRVRVVPYAPAWKGAFEAEANALRSVLGDEALAIHHIGSTSVPDLRAKPTIDLLLVEAREIEILDDLEAKMAEKDYEAWGEYDIPGRRFFTRDYGPDRLCNAHVFEAGILEIARHLAFRDLQGLPRVAPRDRPRLRRPEGDLAERFPTDMEAYMDGKDAFIERVEREALSWSRTRNEAS